MGAIPDGGSGTLPVYGAPLTISFAVAGRTAPLTQCAVDLTLTHSWVGDLDMVLTSPGGTASLVTVSRIGVTTANSVGDSSNYSGLYNFTDAAAGTNIWTVATAAACGDTCNVTVRRLPDDSGRNDWANQSATGDVVEHDVCWADDGADQWDLDADDS